MSTNQEIDKLTHVNNPNSIKLQMEVESTTTPTSTSPDATLPPTEEITVENVTEDIVKLNISEKLLSAPYYPSPGIEQLFLEAAAVEAKKFDQTVFDKKYKVEVPFTDMESLNFCVDYFKFNLHVFVSPNTTKTELAPVLEELSNICKNNGYDYVLFSKFMLWLTGRYRNQCRTFLAFTKHNPRKPADQKKGYFDLDEHPTQYKRRTTLECGGCKKTQNLQLCSKCHTASYCGVECQKKDLSFHKRYCVARKDYVPKVQKKNTEK